ncbi:hypothetical protein KR009_004400 [Drosophila setifemur]|nr:hypothetical protein KR009_004400 [Drosophila setifemur]
MESENSENDVIECAAHGNDSSPALNVMCGICNEFFRANDVIHSTPTCGHIFHKACLARWLKRSSTCPQCRSFCQKNRVHRIYLNFAERTEFDDEEPPKMAYQWVPMDLDEHSSRDAHLAPEGAIQCGSDEEGHPTYVARVYLEEELLPASYVPEKKAVIASWSCQARELADGVEVLVLSDCDHKWVAGLKGSFPAEALQTGYADTGEVTYTGRGVHQGVERLGKVHPSHKVLYMAHQGIEVNTDTYEVLVVTPREHAER